MPVLTCGGIRLQFPWEDDPFRKIPPQNQENLEATVHRAFELGIRHLETARRYGTAELQRGQILPRLPRDQIIVQTKVAPPSSAPSLRRTFAASLN